ncbi:uncharacterized protein LOC108674257 [Hyalella azteca]|uniref:Uncharacterized protein LOC108674257 n=1 Tax=Hyalella azteca TaxID=294128 RepID=A0A8B7NVA7_HYAAZ|nr:uncharacterized protein LOC108674257 [Hyalella azteca]
MSLMLGGHSWWGPGGTGGGGSSGKSAVQLLQESKSQYVKSDQVLGSSQRPARPDRFHISSNPNIFLHASAHTLHATRLSPDPLRRLPAPEEAKAVSPPKTIATLTPSALAEHTNKSFSAAPVRIQRGAPRPRAKTQPISDPFLRGGDLRRSLSHGPADRGVTGGEDIQMKLRKLLDVGSKEKLCQESLFTDKVSPLTKTEVTCGTGTFRAEPAKVTVHKSLPDLWRTSVSTVDSESDVDGALPDKRRPSCPSAISINKEAILNTKFKSNVPAQPPPVPPRKFRDVIRPLPKLPKEPPEVPKRPTVRISPPQIPPRLRPTSGAEIKKADGVLAPSAEGNGRRSSDSDVSVAGGSDEMRRRPILRSKSDITHERCVFGGKDEVDGSPLPSLSGEDLEEFFESMGMDEDTFAEIMKPQEASPTEYFDEKSSEDSIPHRCSSDDEGQPQPAIIRPGEPSIIEKNARIIKWLFTCQRAQGSLAQRPTTKSS